MTGFNMLDSLKKLCFSLVFYLGFISTFSAIGQFYLEDELWRPSVLLDIPKINESGSGFLLQDSLDVYLITAKHVLLNEDGTPKDRYLQITFYPKGYKNDTSYFVIDLRALENNCKLRFNHTQDILAVEIGKARSVDSQFQIISYNESVFRDKGSHVDIYKKYLFYEFDSSQLGDEVVMIGYPKSLGLAKMVDVYDFTKPLFRRGIIAGKSYSNLSYVIDCASYKGNSGSPVIEINYKMNKVILLGMVTQFIPYIEHTRDEMFNIQNQIITSNSGYSVVESLENILKIIRCEK